MARFVKQDNAGPATAPGAGGAVVLSASALHESLADPALESMNFLNEIAGRFPHAVSFAAGRPCEKFFDIDAIPTYLRRFESYLREERGMNDAQIQRTVYQYGRTKGIIHEVLARNLRIDEGIEVDPEAIVVTVGCQEAMLLVLRALCATSLDVVFAVSPGYVGLSGAARVLEREVWPVRETPHGIDLDHLEEQIATARAAGRRPRAVYLIPDFANPSGMSLDRERRLQLLELAERYDLLLLEDNPYGLFRADDGERPPTLKALDRQRRVVYLGSLAKTCFPGARVGYVVADQRVASAGGQGLLADELSKIKSMVSVNTSPIAQAIAAGKMLMHECSLVEANRTEARIYRANLRAVLDGLASRFPNAAALGIRWNAPAGGFFIVVSLPFVVDDAALEDSANEYGVIWTPMKHFYQDDDGGGDRQLRLSVSVLEPAQIDEGLDRLQRFVLARLEQSAQGAFGRVNLD